MAETSTTITVTRSLRSARVAFMVDPHDESQVGRAIAASTGLWGGLYNPIVPVFDATPRWWPRDDDGPPSPDAIVERYLTYFDPDWVVDVTGTYRPPIMGDRVAFLDERSGLSARSVTPVGLALDDVAGELYERRFRFVEHEKPDLVVSDGSSLLGAAALGLAGDWPRRSRGPGLIERLKLEPAELTWELLIRSSIEFVNRAALVTPLTLGMEGVHLRRRAAPQTHLLFGSMRRVFDIVEFWNMRAAALDVVFIALEWLDDLAPFIELVVGDADADVAPTVCQRLTTAQRQRVDAALSAAGYSGPQPQTALQPRPSDRPSEVVAHSDVSTLPITDDRVEVPALDPPIGAGVWPARPGGWVNEIELHDDAMSSTRASVLPHDLEDPDPLVAEYDLRRVRLSQGRLVAICNHAAETLGVDVPSGDTLFAHWAKTRGLRVKSSEPGRVLLEMLRRVGGLGMMGALASTDVLRMLERGTRRHHLPAQEVHQALRRARPGGDPTARLWALTEAQALKAGLLLRCPRCSQTNWIAVDTPADPVRCERCLEDFPFPHHRPPRDWGYRPVGPFAVEKFARGAYASAFAMQTLGHGSGHSATYVPSMEIDGLGELDFALWRAPRFGSFGLPVTPELVLGEAKTFDRFKAVDVERMLAFADRFPDAYVAFATLNDALDTAERRLLGAAAIRLGSKDAPRLIVLTANELLGRGHDLSDAWEPFRDRQRDPLIGLSARTLARASERTYLPRARWKRPGSTTRAAHSRPEKSERSAGADRPKRTPL